MFYYDDRRAGSYFEFSGLKDEIRKVCQEEFLVCGEGDEQGSAWMEKVRLILLILIIFDLQQNIKIIKDAYDLEVNVIVLLNFLSKFYNL